MSNTCPKCNEKLLTTDVFCPYCGVNTKDYSEIDSNEMNQSSSIINCSSCDSMNEPGSEFCLNCGVRLSDDSSSGIEQEESYRYETRNRSFRTYSKSESEEERPWYKPPKRKRSAKHPAEWFFWTGWGLYMLFRVIFQLLFIILRVAARSKR